MLEIMLVSWCTTLGKIDIKGPDAAEFLNRVYKCLVKTSVGKARYDDASRRWDSLMWNNYQNLKIIIMTTTTTQAANVLSHLEYYLQVVWPELKVNVLSTTEQWAGAALAGPKSRDVLAKLFPNLDVSNEALPFMGYSEGNLFGVSARIFESHFLVNLLMK